LTLAQSRSCNGIKHPGFQQAKRSKLRIHKEATDARSRPKEQGVPVKGGFYSVSDLENHVTNYRLLLADTMEGQAAYLLDVISFRVLHAMYREPKKR